MVAWISGARPDLSPENEEVKRKLVKCAPSAYSELIRSDIREPSGARPTRLPFLRPSPLSVMKPSLPPVSKSSSSYVLEPFSKKPTWGELRARLEVLAKKKRSVKRKSQASLEGFPLARPVKGIVLPMITTDKEIPFLQVLVGIQKVRKNQLGAGALGDINKAFGGLLYAEEVYEQGYTGNT